MNNSNDHNSNHPSATGSENLANDVDIGEEPVSKSQRKRDSDAIRDLGEKLSGLGVTELASIPLPDDVLSAIEELQRIKAHGARKRQLGFLAKRLRNTDCDPIFAALEKIRQSTRANTLSLHRVEQWRDRLLGLSADESAKEALTSFLEEFNTADRQHLRHLQSQAIKEQQTQRPPASTRQLFKAIRKELNREVDY